MACSLRFYGDGISFWIVFSQSFWLRALPGGVFLVQPRWMLERRILGGGWTCGVPFWPFSNSSGWWRLIRSVFLTRTSSHKTTHANGYNGAWPGWAISISVFPGQDPVATTGTFLSLVSSWHGQQAGVPQPVRNKRLLTFLPYPLSLLSLTLPIFPLFASPPVLDPGIWSKGLSLSWGLGTDHLLFAEN